MLAILVINIVVYTLQVGTEDFAGGQFFTSFSTGISLPAVVCTTLITEEDLRVEGNQDLTILLESIEPSQTISIVSPSVQTAVILDNDGNLCHSHTWMCLSI